MIMDFAVAQSILKDREVKLAAIEKRLQQESIGGRVIVAAPRGESVMGKIINFAQGFRTGRNEQRLSGGLAGDAAA